MRTVPYRDDLGRFVFQDEPSDEAAQEEAEADEDRRARLEALLTALPEDERLTIQLTLHGKTTREIAKILGCTQTAVIKRWRKAIQRLRFQHESGLIDLDLARLTYHLSFAPGLSTEDGAILASFYRTGSFSMTARMTGFPYSTVRRRLARALGIMADVPQLAPHHRALSALLSTPEIARPRPTGRFGVRPDQR